MGMKVVNNPSEAVFATFTEVLSTAGKVGLDGVAGQGQARCNNDMDCAHEYMVTSRKGKNKQEAPNASHRFIPSTPRGDHRCSYCDKMTA